ncbi:MAG TPA: DUF2269 family protein [Solirubrobacterales bacterium]|nr:DUF2269 family protein [Solirubrobacterales bacterium]
MDITLYEWLLFGHILMAATWVGGDVMLQVLNLRIRNAPPERAVDFMGDVEWVGTRLLTPSALVLVALGFGMVAEGNWSLGDFWISFALGVFLFSFAVGAGFLGPESGRISRLAAERPADDPEVQRRIQRVVAISRIELVLLILVILDMVVKPWL